MSHRFPIALAAAALLVMLAIPRVAHAADLNLRAVLIGGGVVSATESPGSGEALAVLEEDDDLRLDLAYTGLVTGNTGAALHVGEETENGPEIAELDISLDTTEGRVSVAELRLDPDDAARVRAGESYLVIRTIEYPDGAIRGQLAK